MPAVSEFTKAKIVTLHQRGVSYGQISTNLGLSKGTIHVIMRKWEHTGRVVRRPGSGRKRMFSVEQDEAVINILQNCPFSNAEEAVAITHFPGSRPREMSYCHCFLQPVGENCSTTNEGKWDKESRGTKKNYINTSLQARARARPTPESFWPTPE
jgi:hypothetical protein